MIRIQFAHIAIISMILSIPAYADPPPSASQPVKKDVLQAPTQSLDVRISRQKITESDPPPLPEQVVLPMPPTFRLADTPRQVPISIEHWTKARQTLKRGLNFLRDSQNEDGAWMTPAQAAPTDEPEKTSPVSVAVTALAIKALVQADPNAMDSPEDLRAVRFILQARRANGSFDNGPLANYVTSCVVSSFSAINQVTWRDQITEGCIWLQSTQWDQSEGLNARQDWFGGAGYGKHGRPDMSNTQLMLEAMYDAGMSPDEPAFQRALAFVSRAQNLKQTNNAQWTGNDGGFIYTPANGGESMGSQHAGEGRYGEKIPLGQPRSLRSYGSMTYAGFKSMLYAGLSPDDVRVRAAFDWIRHHWTFDENPGLGQQGLYYYYHTIARALSVGQQHTITDINDQSHNWREELIDALSKRQQTDGSWRNDADRWLEGDPVLATIYALLALEETLKPTLQISSEKERLPVDP